MACKITQLDADVAIIGGGPGGCTLAKELSAKGKKVVLLEKGGDDKRFLGSVLGNFIRLEKSINLPVPLKQTQEGDTVILANCLGGGTLLYAGAAAEPDTEYWKRHGIELEQRLIDEARDECWVTLPPDEFVGAGAKRIQEAANEIGIPFEKQGRHVDFSKCKKGCEVCVNGCRYGAKWTAKEFANEAIKNGATVLCNTEAKEIIIEDGVAGGVRAKNNGTEYEVNAKVVVCSGGGMYTARILQRSGFPTAGSWFTGDPTFFTFGFIKDGSGNSGEHNMTMGWHDEENHVLFCSMISPFPAWHLQIMQDEGIKSLSMLHRFGKVLGVFAKVSDDGKGKVETNGKISKTFTEQDQKRFEYSRDVNTRILVKAGCKPDDIHNSSFVMGHPSGTVRVGELVDTNLETSVKNLYCCDTSVFPEAPGIPPAWTIVVLAKRLAQRLETAVLS